MTYDEFCQIVNEEMDLLPPYVYEELNGGVLIEPGAHLHPARLEDDLYILGTYSSGGLFGKGTLIEEDKERMRQYYMRHGK